LAGDLMKDICQRESVNPGQVILHSDNGNPMKRATMRGHCNSWESVPRLADRQSVITTLTQNRCSRRWNIVRNNDYEQVFSGLGLTRTWVNGFVD
jgi:putative transposase